MEPVLYLFLDTRLFPRVVSLESLVEILAHYGAYNKCVRLNERKDGWMGSEAGGVKGGRTGREGRKVAKERMIVG